MTVTSLPTDPWQKALVTATPEPIFLLLVWMGGVGLFILAGLRLYDRYLRHRSHIKRQPVKPATDEDLLS